LITVECAFASSHLADCKLVFGDKMADLQYM